MEEYAPFMAAAKTIHNAVTDWISAYLEVIGIFIAIYAAMKAKSAAKAATEARDEVHKFDALVVLAEIVRGIDQLKALNRQNPAYGMEERYSSVRMQLVDVRQRTAGLTRDQTEQIQKTIQLMKDMEEALDAGRVMDKARVNRSLTEHGDALRDILNRLRAIR